MAIDFLMSDEFDLQIGSDGDYLTTDTFETAAVCGLFFPERSNGRRGHYAFVDGEGSRLWLLEQAKLTSTNLNNARRYANDGTQFLLTDGLVESITNEVTGDNQKLILITRVVEANIEIEREFIL